ncbi:MAG: hypothetical protein VX112_03865 [Pseudomonadota bacterium]|nr:hypothetical protein [Pseudomonadota bacterium]
MSLYKLIITQLTNLTNGYQKNLRNDVYEPSLSGRWTGLVDALIYLSCFLCIWLLLEPLIENLQWIIWIKELSQTTYTCFLALNTPLQVTILLLALTVVAIAYIRNRAHEQERIDHTQKLKYLQKIEQNNRLREEENLRQSLEEKIQQQEETIEQLQEANNIATQREEHEQRLISETKDYLTTNNEARAMLNQPPCLPRDIIQTENFMIIHNHLISNLRTHIESKIIELEREADNFTIQTDSPIQTWWPTFFTPTLQTASTDPEIQTVQRSKKHEIPKTLSDILAKAELININTNISSSNTPFLSETSLENATNQLIVYLETVKLITELENKITHSNTHIQTNKTALRFEEPLHKIDESLSFRDIDIDHIHHREQNHIEPRLNQTLLTNLYKELAEHSSQRSPEINLVTL